MRASRLLIAALAAFTLAYVGCDQPTDSDPELIRDATVYGTVGGYVVDATSLPMSGVAVSSSTGSNSKAVIHGETYGKGWFELSGFISGVHTLLIGTSQASASVRTTTTTYYFHVPELDELRDAAYLP